MKSLHDWLWLVSGTVFLAFTQFQDTVPIAAWLAPIFLLRFARKQPPGFALPLLALAHYLASVFSLQGVFSGVSLFLFSIAGIIGVIPYAFDRLIYARTPLWMRTLAFPAAATVLDWVVGKSQLGTLGSVAYSQFGLLSVMQLVSITGVTGLVFLMNWLAPVVNEVWNLGFNSQTKRLAAVFCVILAVVLTYGTIRVNGHTWSKHLAARTRVTALSMDAKAWFAAVPPLKQLAGASETTRAEVRAKFAPIIDELFARTDQHARAGARVVSWSEGAAPVLKEDEPALINRAQSLARDRGIFLQIAVISMLRSDHLPYSENRVLMIDPSGEVRWDYSKTCLALGEVREFGSYEQLLLVNVNGRLAVSIDPKGRGTTKTYDALGWQLARSPPMGQSDSNHFNAKGQLDQHDDFLGQKAEYVYGRFGRVRAEFDFNAGSDWPSNAVCYGHNQLGQLAKIIERSGPEASTITCDGYAALVGAPSGPLTTGVGWAPQLFRLAAKGAPAVALALFAGAMCLLPGRREL